MDNSSILFDNAQYRIKLGETLESGFNLIEKVTLNIYKEINKLRDEYLTVINKFVDYCDREGLQTDFFEDNYSRTSLDKENSICSNIKQPSAKNVAKYYKFPLNDLKKLKIEKVDNKKNNNKFQMFNLLPGNSTPGKSGYQINNQFSKVTNFNSKSKNNRSKTPVTKSQPKKEENKRNETSNNSNYNLNELNLIKHLPKISNKKIADTEEFYKSGYANKNATTPNKKGLKNAIIFNPNNNYTKKFIKKQSIENLSKIIRREKRVNTTNPIGINPKSKVRPNLSSTNKNINMTKTTYKNTLHDMTDGSIENKDGNINIISNFNNSMESSNSKINLNNTKDEIKENYVTTNINNTYTTNSSNTNNTNNNLNINISNLNFGVNNSNKLCILDSKKIDYRKMSILDIPGDPLVLAGLVKEMERSHAVSNISNIPIRQSKLNKNLLEKLSNNKLKVFYLMAYSDITPIRIRIMFSKLNKSIYSEYSSKCVIQDYRFLLHDKILQIENSINFYLSIPEYDRKINRHFTPSKTAQNGLNFITKEDELTLLKENFDNSECKGIFKFVFILLKYNFEKLEETNKSPADFLLNTVLVKMKLNNLKSLFLNVICHSLLINHDQYTNIVSLVEQNKAIINPGIIINGNRVLTYMKFILKEIYEYLTMKTDDGVLILNLKRQKQELKKCKEKLLKLNNYL